MEFLLMLLALSAPVADFFMTIIQQIFGLFTPAEVAAMLPLVIGYVRMTSTTDVPPESTATIYMARRAA